MQRPRGGFSGGMFGHDDIFQGFGGPSLFPDFFARDPFNDPFFTDPFGSFFGRGRSQPGGQNGMFGGSMFGDMGMFGQPSRGFLEQRPFAPPQEARRGPIIEELPEDHDGSSVPVPRSNGEPIVEHPDDEHPDNGRHAASSRAPHVRHNQHNPYRSQNVVTTQPGFSSQSYSYSSVSYGGTGGTYYSSSTTRKIGPDGILEEEHEEHDSTAGQEIKRLSRGLADKGHSVARVRPLAQNSEGREQYIETLHNLTEEEKNEFDETWKRRAEKSLPGWKRSRNQMLDAGHASHGRQARAALPSSSSGSSRERTRGARHA